MPCRDFESDWGVNWIDSKSVAIDEKALMQNDRLARIACKAMQELERLNAADFLLLKDEEVATWWTAHKEADRKAQEEQRRREAAIEAKRKKAELKARALSKLRDVLSKEEIAALGLDKQKGKS